MKTINRSTNKRIELRIFETSLKLFSTARLVSRKESIRGFSRFQADFTS